MLTQLSHHNWLSWRGVPGKAFTECTPPESCHVLSLIRTNKIHKNVEIDNHVESIVTFTLPGIADTGVAAAAPPVFLCLKIAQTAPKHGCL